MKTYTTIDERLRVIGLKYYPLDAQFAGTIVSQAYEKEFNNKPIKVKRKVGDTDLLVNVYPQSFITIMDNLIRDYLTSQKRVETLNRYKAREQRLIQFKLNKFNKKIAELNKHNEYLNKMTVEVEPVKPKRERQRFKTVGVPVGRRL